MNISLEGLLDAPKDSANLQPYENVKDLFIDSINLALIDKDECMVFIERMFPNIGRLSLLSSHKLFNDTRRVINSPRPSTKITLQFSKFVFKTPNFSVDCLITNGNTVNIIAKMFNNSKPVPLTRSNKALIIRYRRINLLIRNNVLREGITESIGIRCNKQDNQSETEISLWAERVESTSCVEIIQSIGQHYQHLTVDSIPISQSTSLLHLVVQHCIRLTSLTILNRAELGPLNLPISTTEHPLKNMTLSTPQALDTRFTNFTAPAILVTTFTILHKYWILDLQTLQHMPHS